MDDDSNIYKLVGPVLLKQERSDALMAVNGRLDFIEKEVYGTYNKQALRYIINLEARFKLMWVVLRRQKTN